MKVIDIYTDSNGMIVSINDNGLVIHIDVYESNGEITCDWNKYIFFDHNDYDQKVKTYQSNIDNFIKCSELAIEAYEHETP